MQNTEAGAPGSHFIDQVSQFHKLPEIDQKEVLKNLNTYCCGNPDRIDARMAKTAFTATIAPGCAISGKIKRKEEAQGEILLVPIKQAPLQIEVIPIAVEFLRSQIRSLNQPLAQPA